MRIVKTKAYARAGLIGNPSDGYHGRTISLIVKNFAAEVVLYEWSELEIGRISAASRASTICSATCGSMATTEACD